MSRRRKLHLNLVGNELGLHQGTPGYEHDHSGGPDRRDVFASMLEMASLDEEDAGWTS